MARAERLALVRALAETAATAGIPLGDTTSPGQLARRHDQNMKARAHVAAMDNVLTAMLGTPNARVMIFSPPQVGKSSMTRWFAFWWLTMHPKHRLVLASYAASLAVTHGSAVRDMVRMYGDRYGLIPHPTEFTKAAWRLRTGGGLRSVGVGGGLAGQSMDLGLIDDPVKDRAEAESAVYRNSVWDWYSSVFSSRRQPGTRELLVMCMTGDTPVLRPDGTETPLRDVRAGDVVATYEDGALSAATVRKWSSQGNDQIFRITLKSGRTVRANARHPFLTVENGEEVWQRTDSLRRGSAVLTATGVSIAASSARRTGATSQRSAAECACRTTTRRDGPTDTDRRPSTRSQPARSDCATRTASNRRTTTACSPSRTGSAQSAGEPLTVTSSSTAAGTCVSTTTTTQAGCAACSATTATSRSDMHGLSKSSTRLLSTYSVTPDEVVSVTPCGVDEVFDLTIDRTENFIANGLVSHNTRYHQDDLAGRLLDRDGRVEDGGEWVVLHMPAIALAEDHERGIYQDPLGRAPGEPISHPLIDADDTDALLDHWKVQRARSTDRDWNSLYLGVPWSAEGALLTDDDVRAATAAAPASFDRVAVGVDPSGDGRDSAGVVVAGLAGGTVWFLDDKTARMSTIEWPRRVCLAAHEHDATTIVVETNYGGGMATTLITQAWEQLAAEGAVSGLCPYVQSVSARKSKALRAEPIAQAIKTGRARFAAGGNLRQIMTEWKMWEPGSSWSPGALDAGVHVAVALLPEARGTDLLNPASRTREAGRVGGIAGRRLA